MFRNLSLLFLCLFFLIACDEITKKEKEECVKNCEESSIIEESKKEKKEKEKQKEEVSTQQLKSNEAIVLDIYKDNFVDIMEVTFNEDTKTYEFLSNDPEFISELYGLVAGTVDIAGWNYMVESLVGMSNSSIDILGNGYGITIINPVNTENYLLHIIDGIVVYDAFNE